jgi:flagellar motor switch protein FliM
VSSETLSQNEIDQLLGGGGGTARSRAAANRGLPADVQVYDFSRPHRVSKDRMRSLEAIYERLVKSLESWLMGRVRGHVELRLQSVEQFSFGEFQLSLPTPCAAYIFEVHDSGGQQAVLDFGLPFAYFLVDRLFGGAGTTKVPDRALTPIERMALRTVADRVAQALAEVWQDNIALDLRLNGFESIPEILRAANREDPVLVANIDVSTGEMSSILTICLPFAVLESFFTSGAQRRADATLGSEREREVTREITESSLRATRLDLAARLPDFRLAMRDLAALRVGGVISTGIPTDVELEVRVNGNARFRAVPGRTGRKLALRIIETLHPADDATAAPNPDLQPADA